jgi:hypothetical protein
VNEGCWENKRRGNTNQAEEDFLGGNGDIQYVRPTENLPGKTKGEFGQVLEIFMSVDISILSYIPRTTQQNSTWSSSFQVSQL